MENSFSEAQQSNNPFSALQKIRPDLLGFVFQLSWLYFLLYDNTLTGKATEPSTADALYLSSALPLIITLLVGIVAPRRFQTIAESHLGIYGTPAITALGTIVFCVDQTCSSFFLICIGGCLTGVGSAVLAVRWATAFGRATPREILENFPFLLAIIFVICASCLYVPLILRYVLVIILPILSGIMLQYAKRCYGSTNKKTRKYSASQALILPIWIKKQWVALICIGLIALISFNEGLLVSFRSGTFNYAALFFSATAILVLGFVSMLLYQIDRSSILLILGLPLVIIIITFLPFARFLVNSPANVLPSIGSIALELTLLTGCVLFALVTDRAVGKTFMIGRCTMAIFDLLGSFAGDQITTHNTDWALQLAAICLLVAIELLLAGLMAGYFIICRIQKGRNNLAPAMVDEYDSVPSVVEVSDIPKVLDTPESKPERIPEANTATTSNAPSATEALLPSEIPPLPEVELNVKRSPEKTLQENDHDIGGCVISLDARINEIVTTYNLSARERDVFTLLAKGRSSARIQEDLCIAAGTVNYHTRNIYAKLGVHNRQQIIDLLEQA